MITNINTTSWERSSEENWTSPSSNSLQMLVNLDHDYIVSDVQYANYTISSDVTVKENDDDGIGVVFDYIDSQNYKYIMYHGGGLSGWNSVYIPVNDITPKVILVDVVDGIHNRIAYNLNYPAWSINSTFNVKLSNIFSDIVFYVNNNEVLRYRKEDTLFGKIGFVTYSQIADFDNIEIYKTHTNRAVAKFKLIGVGDSDIETEITSRVLDNSDIETELTPKVFGYNVYNTDLNVMYRGNSDVEVEIQPYGFIDLETEIYIRPHNRMWAMYEVIQPPIIQSKLPPIMDSFTRSESAFSTINYGNGISMVVGDDIAGNRWTSYIRFDLTSVNPSLLFTEAKMRLYTANYPTIDIEVYEVAEVWQEYSITQLNAPIVHSKLLADEYYYDSVGNYIEFDLTEKIVEWIKNPKNNYGFMLRLKDGSNGQAIFRTREHPMHPEIIVSYYDPAIFSTGRSEILIEIKAMKSNVSDKNTEIEVGSVFNFSVYDTYIYARQPDIPVENDIEVEITATYDTPKVDLTVAIRTEDDKLTELNVLSGDNLSRVDSEIIVSKPLVHSEIFVRYQDIKDTYIYARAYAESNLETEITVSKNVVLTEIDVRVSKNEDIETELTVTQDLIGVEITVLTFEDIPVEIDIDPLFASKHEVEITVSQPFIPIEINPRVEGRHSVYTSIDVTRDEVHVIIGVKERSTIDVEIDVIGSSKFNAEIEVSKPYIFAEISPRVFGEDSLDSEIYVKWINLIEVEIDARATSQLDVEVNVKKTSNIEVDLTVSKPMVFVEIYPRILGEYDRPTVIEPRILMVENLNTIIVVNGKRGAYGFVM